jgi:hypothetical protein
MTAVKKTESIQDGAVAQIKFKISRKGGFDFENTVFCCVNFMFQPSDKIKCNKIYGVEQNDCHLVCFGIFVHSCTALLFFSSA